MFDSELITRELDDEVLQEYVSEDPRVGEELKKNKYMGVPFLILVIFIYVISYFFFPAEILEGLKATGALAVKIFPVIIILIIIMGIADYFSDPEMLKKYLGEGSGVKGWVIAIVTGIISAGPIYLWYPLLCDLKKKGMKNSLIAVFLYNRAIKIPLTPILIYYFGFKFVLIMLVGMIGGSILQGILMDFIYRHKKVK